MDSPVNPTSGSPNPTDDAIVKVKMYANQAYDKTAEVTRETYRKIDEKYHDPQFQQDMKDFKEKVGVKGRELGNTTIEYSNKAYFGLKSGMSSAWQIIQDKYKDLNKENISQQTTTQTSLKEELLKKDEKEVD